MSCCRDSFNETSMSSRSASNVQSTLPPCFSNLLRQRRTCDANTGRARGLGGVRVAINATPRNIHVAPAAGPRPVSTLLRVAAASSTRRTTLLVFFLRCRRRGRGRGPAAGCHVEGPRVGRCRGSVRPRFCSPQSGRFSGSGRSRPRRSSNRRWDLASPCRGTFCSFPEDCAKFCPFRAPAGNRLCGNLGD